MEIKLKKDWRAFGEIQTAGKILKIQDKKTLKFLKENDYIETSKKSKIKDDNKIIKENN
tara:strand:+ start:3094 stop:3270 length:177 start_codon:yes stop_codon:yes gene_type:complete